MTLTEEFSQAVHDLRALDRRDLVLFVLRHAESLGQKQQEAYKTLGDGNIPLTPLGVKQGQAAGKILKKLTKHGDLEDVQLISSTGHRSTRTTFEIFTRLKQDTFVNFDDRLNKQKFGLFDGLFSSAEREAACPEEFAAFQAVKNKPYGIFYAQPPEGESIQMVQDRMRPFFEERKAKGSPTIVVTHGTNALCLEDIALDRGVSWIIDRLDTRPNCAIRMITGNDEKGYTARTVCTDPIAMLKELKQKDPALTP